MIHEAAEAGADYVKIQGLRSSELVYRERFESGRVGPNGDVLTIKRPFAAEVDRLSRLDLTDDDEKWFVSECARAGVKSMITAFTLGSVSRFAAAGFSALKIASYDCKSEALLQEARAFSDIVVSTGASFNDEISRAAKILSGTDAAFLHCVTIYPTPLNQLHLQRMNWLRSFSKRVGFSDHTAINTTALRASKLAIVLGADIVERHFTALPTDATRDGPVSINQKQLRQLRRFSELPIEDQRAELSHEWPEWESGLGETKRDLSPAEMLNRDYYSGRVASWQNGVQIGSDGLQTETRSN